MNRVRDVGFVAHQPADCDDITVRISRWNPVTRRQGSKLPAAVEEECVGSDEEGIGALARKGGKGRIDLTDRTGVEYLDLQPDGGAGFLRLSRCDLGVESVGRIDEH